MNKFFELVFLTFFLTFASNPVFAVEDVVKNNETKLQETEIILPEDTKLPEHDVNKDGVIDDKDVIVDETEENFLCLNYWMPQLNMMKILCLVKSIKR